MLWQWIICCASGIPVLCKWITCAVPVVARPLETSEVWRDDLKQTLLKPFIILLKKTQILLTYVFFCLKIIITRKILWIIYNI